MSLPVMSLVVALTVGAMSTSSASAKMANLVLKEEGVPVAAGAELGVELEAGYHCMVAWRGHLSLNDASADKITVEPVQHECTSEELYPSTFKGGTDEVELIHTGKVWIRGSWEFFYENARTPGPYCTVDFEQIRGMLEMPGPTQTGASGRTTLVKEWSPNGGPKCHKKGRIYLNATVRGQNGKPLETELVR
jgi:hypothetical protein